MFSKKITREQLWARQQITIRDVDYTIWNRKKKSLQQLSRFSPECIFTVDVFKGRYDFASGNFADIFGYNPAFLKNICQHGDLLEERIHPEDRSQLIDMQIKHSQFIYSLPPENRNDYRQSFQYRMLNRKQHYVNVVSTQQVIQTDCNGKAWIVMGVLNISPDQLPGQKVKSSVLNLKTGTIVNPQLSLQEAPLTRREKEILYLISQGLLSKEIACRLNLSIYTVNNHRKNILSKLNAVNSIEAIRYAHARGMLD